MKGGIKMDGNSIAIIVVAIVGAVATIVSNVVISGKQSREMDAKLDKNQAVIEERIVNLKEAVDKHNNFAQKIPALETEIKNLNSRIDKLENKVDSILKK